MKDNFSNTSPGYAQFRPNYPEAFFDFLFEKIPAHQIAWDCGTGTGQVAAILAREFQSVLATDISSNQLRHAIQKENITYLVKPAEDTGFPDRHFDLITVAQAIHWFDFERFYGEVYRTLKLEGLIAVIGYALCRINKEVDAVVDQFYGETLSGYWDWERKYLDELYATIPFPFDEIEVPQYEMSREWTFEQMIGFLNTWSAVQHFIRQNHSNPVDDLREELNQYWPPEQIKKVHFPFLARVGRLGNELPQ